MRNTFYGGVGDKAKFIDDQQNLVSDLSQLTKEDLRERLFVAEKVMKSLFQRNRELELNAEKDENGEARLEVVQTCQLCAQTKEDAAKATQTLEGKLAKLEKEVLNFKGKDENQSYKNFMAKRLGES